MTGALLVARLDVIDVGSTDVGRRVKAMAAFVERRGFLSVLYVRLLPGVPYTLFNYAVGLTRVSLVVAWFGDDLRCGTCTIRPKVEAATRTVKDTSWVVSGIAR